MTDEEPTAPHAEVEQVGRWTYLVSVHDGLTVWGPAGIGWRVFGRRRARRKAEKVLLRYVELRRRRASVERVRLADG